MQPSQSPSTNLSAGKQFAHYQVLCSLGAGGMGEVYRARDTRLGREVAIKVLPEKMGADPELLQEALTSTAQK